MDSQGQTACSEDASSVEQCETLEKENDRTGQDDVKHQDVSRTPSPKHRISRRKEKLDEPRRRKRKESMPSTRVDKNNNSFRKRRGIHTTKPRDKNHSNDSDKPEHRHKRPRRQKNNEFNAVTIEEPKMETKRERRRRNGLAARSGLMFPIIPTKVFKVLRLLRHEKFIRYVARYYKPEFST